MTGRQWTDAELDAMRMIGDPLADDLVSEIFATGEVHAVRRLLRGLVDDDHPLVGNGSLPPELMAHVERYFALSDAALPEFDPARIVAGQQVFELHGAEVLMVLCCYSLPASYTAKKGVHVLGQTGRLESHPKRRLLETTQMVVDVMTPGGLVVGENARNHGKGIRSAQKVRLMHAAIRRLILDAHGQEWIDKYQIPINQEDLAGTLMTFSRVVLDGLARLGAPTTVLQRESYLYAWRAIGRVMGVREELIPADLDEARTLTDTIRRRQSAKSDVGDAMTAALLAVMEDSLPRVLHGFPPTLLRFFLEDDVKYLTMPPANWTRVLVVIMHAMTRAVDLLVGASRVSRWLYRAFNKRLIEGFLEVERGPKRPNFAIPDHLARQWGVKD
jgi:hypothetical protein